MIASPHPALRMVSDLLTPDMIDEIAAADYGNDIERHRAAIVEIAKTGTTPEPLLWHPTEVLELIRWSEPENPNWKPGRTGEQGHVMRAFCCTALLQSGHSIQNRRASLGYADTAIHLVESLDHLDPALKRHACDLLSSLAKLLAVDQPENLDSPLLMAGALWLAATHGTFDPKAIDGLLDAAEASLVEAQRSPFIFNMVNQHVRGDKWKQRAEKLYLSPLNGLEQRHIERVRSFALQIHEAL
jgi:hypothetical protein